MQNVSPDITRGRNSHRVRNATCRLSLNEPIWQPWERHALMRASRLNIEMRPLRGATYHQFMASLSKSCGCSGAKTEPAPGPSGSPRLHRCPRSDRECARDCLADLDCAEATSAIGSQEWAQRSWGRCAGIAARWLRRTLTPRAVPHRRETGPPSRAWPRSFAIRYGPGVPPHPPAARKRRARQLCGMAGSWSGGHDDEGRDSPELR
jgi:hypothetical protein